MAGARLEFVDGACPLFTEWEPYRFNVLDACRIEAEIDAMLKNDVIETTSWEPQQILSIFTRDKKEE